MASLFRKIFPRKKKAPLVCAVALDDNGNIVGEDPNHQHTAACFLSFEPLAVAELFQSQGCTSCPQALPGIHSTTTNLPNMVLLTMPVTLFDHLGWKDTLASSSWDARQRGYVRKWQRNSIFTPHMVINGVADGSGAEGKEQIEDILARGREEAKRYIEGWNIYMDASDTHIRIDTDKQDAGQVFDVVLLTYKPGDQTVKVAGGPNKGKKLVHRNLVQNIVKIGEWTGGNAEIQLPTPTSALPSGVSGVVVLQQPGLGGAIIQATKI